MDPKDRVVNATYYLEQRAGHDRCCDDWNARHLFSNSPVLVKFLKEPDTWYQPQGLDQFKARLGQLVSASHEGVERVLDSGTWLGRSYFAILRSGSRPLPQWFDSPLEHPVQDTLQVAIRIARALEFMHARGVVHGHFDFDALQGVENIEGTYLPRVCGYYEVGYDLLAAARASGARGRGPDRGLQAAPDPQEDVRAFGQVFYRLLTGISPAPRARDNRVLAPVSSLNPRVPAELDRIVLRSVGAAPEAAYASVAELLEDLVRLSIDFPSVLAAGQAAPWGRWGVSRPEFGEATEQPTSTKAAERRPAPREPAPRARAARAQAPRKPGLRKPAARRSTARRPGAAATKAGPVTRARPGPARQGGSHEEALQALIRLCPRFAGREREVHEFRQAFYDLYIPRGRVYLIDQDQDPGAAEKLRLLAYFRDLLRFSRGRLVRLRAGSGTQARGLERMLLEVPRRDREAQEAARSRSGAPAAAGRTGLARVLALLKQLWGRQGPLAVVIRGLERLDTPSLCLLLQLDRRIAAKPYLILGILSAQRASRSPVGR
jgi:hypothetical protein